ncbi:MAG TPA: CHAT domain-containing protein [Blastocatellia bacterium]|nr:CHAT domain-containing protein [Blastocatellia bacterium]
MKILILAANPKGTTQLRLDEEVREIKEGLHRSINRDKITLEERWAVRIKDLRRAMLDIRPRFVHFSGHGETEGLVLEDKEGRAQLVSNEALSSLFKLFTSEVKCVLLNACYSATQAEAISKHIPYVIGMKKEIGDRAAIEFAVGFYDAIGAGRSVEEAFEFGRNAILSEEIPEHLTPILHNRETEPIVQVNDIEPIEASVDYSQDREARQPQGGKTTNGSVPRRIPPAIWVAVISGIVAIITAYWQVVYKPGQSDSGETVQYAGRVIDARTQQVIPSAKVSIDAQGAPQVYYTDAEGIFNIKLRSSNDAVRIRVEANNYEILERNVSLVRSGIEDIRLQPRGTVSPPPQEHDLTGIVKSQNDTVEGAEVIDVRSGNRVHSDSEGRFTLKVNETSNGWARIRVSKGGYVVWEDYVRIGSNLVVPLQRQ